MPMHDPRHQTQVTRTSSRSTGSALSTFISRPLRHPRTTTALLLWVLGLYAVFLAPAPVKITPEKAAAFESKVRQAEGLIGQLMGAERKLMDAQLHMREAQVWFWRFKEPRRREVAARRPAVDAAYKEVKVLRKQRDALLRDAKASLGVWSEAGLEESRAILWDNFNWSKNFAKRQTFWDTLFNVFDSRDKDWMYLLLQLLLTALVNYTIGAIAAVFSFAMSLPSFLASFAPSWPSAIAFFVVAVIGAISLVASYLALLYAAGTAVVVTATSFASMQRQRLEASSRRRPEALRGPGMGATYRRNHYD